MEQHDCGNVCREMPIAEWVDTHRVISVGPHVGDLMRSDLTPFLMEILEFVLRPPEGVREGAVRKAARIGYTEAVIGTAVVYTEALEPSPIAVLQPSIKEAQAYSRENITPMMNHIPAFRHVGDKEFRTTMSGRRSSDNNLLYKVLPKGATLYLLGSGAATQLGRRDIRRMLVDEVDRMRPDPKEGSPLARAKKRTMMWPDGVMLTGSTPLLRTESLIDGRYRKSDQRRWFVICPNPECEHEQYTRWSHIEWSKVVVCRACGSVLDSDEECACGVIDKVVTHLPETARWKCEKCDHPVQDGEEKRALVRGGRWIATNPLGTFPGWHVPAFISLFPTATWAILAQEWLDAQTDMALLKVFINEVLGESFEDPTKRPKVNNLQDRAEQYTAPNGEVIVVPDGVGVLTAGVDVQKDWMELIVRGWGIDDESYDIVHQRFHGLPQHQRVWGDLDAWLTRAYLHQSGLAMRILCTLVDSGGEWTGHVYNFTRPREGRMVFASKGDSGKSGAPIVKLSGPEPKPGRPLTLAQRTRVQLYTVGTFTAKDLVIRRLKIEKPGPGFVHLRRHDPDISNGFDGPFFQQFEAEAKHLVRKTHGRDQYAWVQLKKRNEALDLHVLAAAAFECLAIRSEMPQRVALASRGRVPRPRQHESAGVVHPGHKI